MVVVSLILLVVMTFTAEKFSFSKKGYTIKVQFKDISGLTLSSPVMFNGYEMGVVENIAIKEGKEEVKIELTLWLNQKARLRKGDKVYVKNLGLMGEKYVGIVSKSNNAPYLQEGAFLIGEDPVDFEKLMEDGQGIAKQLNEVSQNINELLEKNKETIDEILVGVNETLKNAHSISDDLDDLMDVNKGKVDRMVANLEATSKNLEEMSLDLKLHPWKIMYKGKDK